MTAADFAGLLNAKRAGSGKWSARCPAHPDKNPSLNIRQGERGVLIKCMSAGCTVRQIVSAMGLRMSDLFDGPSALPEQIRDAASRQRLGSVLNKAANRQRRELNARLWKYEKLQDELGAELMRDPASRMTAWRFHLCCDYVRLISPIFKWQTDGPCRIEATPLIPQWIQTAFREIASSFQECNSRSEPLAA